jgi:hypothetical protein
VVDVTNLENGRTIRVIVAAGLDSPGLLAMLSRNAASAIGVQPRAIGRIRMSQPSDPVAFSRFTEESELPEGMNSPAAAPNAVVSSTVRTATAGDLASSTPEDQFYRSVINRPEAYVPPAVAYPQDGSVLTEPQPAWLTEETDSAALIGETPDPVVSPPAYEPPLMAVPGPDPAYPQPMLVAPAPQTAEPIPPQPNTSLNSTPYAWQVSPPYIAPSTAIPALPPDSVITLEPAEERPPQSAARELLPVPPPPRQAARPESAGPESVRPDSTRDDTYLDPRYFIGPIPRLSGPAQPPARVINPPQPAPPPPPQKTAEPALNGSIFSVPIITRLEDGKQYVQIGAFTRPDTLETAVARARRSYPLAVQTGGSNTTLVYKLLIGPLNAGESAAVAQSVRNGGFPDAFIRR